MPVSQNGIVSESCAAEIRSVWQGASILGYFTSVDLLFSQCDGYISILKSPPLESRQLTTLSE